MPDDKLTIVHVRPTEIREAEYNPRRATKKQFDDLKASIEKFGFVEPIIVNTYKDREGVIVGGHFRVKVAKAIGLETIPAIMISVPLEREMELNLRLNKNTGEFDRDMLANLDREILYDVGFHPLELNAIFEPSVSLSPEEPPADDHEPTMKKCPRCGHEFTKQS